jgi:hypothetical protein
MNKERITVSKTSCTTADKIGGDVGDPMYLYLPYILIFVILASSALSFSQLISSFILPCTSFMVQSNSCRINMSRILQEFFCGFQIVAFSPRKTKYY